MTSVYSKEYNRSMNDNTPNPNKQKIIELRKQGLSYGSIAKLVKLSRARVHQIYNDYSSPANNRKYNDIKEIILLRDSYKCQWKELCKKKVVNKKDLIVHHIDFNDKNNRQNNLITLCKFCHSSFHFKQVAKDRKKREKELTEFFNH